MIDCGRGGVQVPEVCPLCALEHETKQQRSVL